MRPRHGAAARGARAGRRRGRRRRASACRCPRPRRPRPVSAYVKISDGCDRRCSFCAIPLIKGDYETVPAAEILRAARARSPPARASSCSSARTPRAGRSPDGAGSAACSPSSPALDRRPPGCACSTCSPTASTDELLEALAAHAVPYVDVPLQHASGAVLRRMGRSGDGAAHLALLARVRARCPGAAVRSTFIAGFPGETDAEFEELDRLRARGAARGRRRVRLRRAGGHAGGRHARRRAPRSSPSSAPPRLGEAHRPGGRAASGALSPARRSTSWSSAARRAPDGVAVGRIALQAPDVDGRTTLTGARARRGQIVRAVVRDSLGYDVEAVAATGGL